MNNPKITVITPSYNQGAFIEETILSVINQNYNNAEYLIIDGGSTDNTVDVIKKYEKRITYWISEKDSGQSNAINKGLRRATGDIIAWLNSDDHYQQGALQKVADAFASNPEASCFIGKIRFFEAGGTKYYSNNIIFETLAKTIGYGRINQPAIFISKSFADKMGPINETLHHCMDLDWWLRYLFLCGQKDIVQSDDVVVNFRIHSLSKTQSSTHNFDIEKDNIYYSLALKSGNSTIAELIRENTSLLHNYNFIFPRNSDTSMLNTALHYHLLLRANEYYVEYNRDVTKKYLKMIDKTLLAPEDRKLYRKLYIRNTFIPGFIIKLFRKK